MLPIATMSRSSHRTPLLPCLLALAPACSTASSSGDTAPPVAAGEEKPAFENPGGMWMPSQMSEHAETLKELGLTYDPSALTDPTSFPLGAIVSLGGCSASFVSPDGLIVTNHHCVTGTLQYNSTPEQNLLTDGYLAKTRADEKWAGPTARVYVTTSFADVTEQVLGGLEGLKDDQARYDEREKRIKDLTAKCEEGKPDVRCRIASYFEGATYVRIEQLQIKDVRLVYAPHAGVGVYGGEIDNWRWPRHTGDFSFLRAYVGKDGQPAEHADDNVPYKPPHYLKVATDPLRAGDLVMVAGYPGRTYRLKTAAEVQEAAQWYYPHRIAMFEEYIATLNAATEGRKDAKIKVASRLRGLNNYLTNYKGMRDGLVKGGLAAERAKLEGELRAWIDADPERKKTYGNVLPEMEKIHAEQSKTREHDTAFSELVGASALMGAANTIVKMAEQRQKPDAERDPGYQERNWKRRKQGMTRMSRTYDPQVDRAALELFVNRALKLPEAQQPKEALAALLGDGPYDEKKIGKALDNLYKKTKLGDEKQRVKLLENAKPKQLERSRDPFIKAALKLRPVLDAQNERDERASGALATLRPKYIAALREFTKGPMAPDANGTLRITYGTVRGYKPTPDAETYVPFTTVTEMVKKHTDEEPFDAPDAVLAAVKAGDFGPYADDAVGDLPVNFLADLDITGGNSGSATLNARGELVGLAFDGNYEAMASDWIFMPDITRSIQVDARYMLWVMDAVDGADHVIEEMGLTPAIAGAPPAKAAPADEAPAKKTKPGG